MLEKFDGIQIFIAAIFVGHPLSILLAIIKVQHRSHSVHAQSVDMILLDPVDRAVDQEILDLIFSGVKNLRAPIRMLSLLRVGVLK